MKKRIPIRRRVAYWLCFSFCFALGFGAAEQTQAPGIPVAVQTHTPGVSGVEQTQKPGVASAVQTQTPDQSPVPGSAREALIDDIIALAQALYEKADGDLQRAHYKEDRYVCKNFVSHLLYEAGKHYRMAAYPNARLRLPENLPAEDCEPYRYGIAWRDTEARDGNPFYVAASFRYDDALTEAENRAMARAMLEQVSRGDFFQMYADYEYGHTPHSLLFIAPYDAQADTLRWTDSNMIGKTIGGERYGIVQFDAQAAVDWFVDAICFPKHGATLYRLREDIVLAEAK